jgi:hypothetical protein
VITSPICGEILGNPSGIRVAREPQAWICAIARGATILAARGNMSFIRVAILAALIALASASSAAAQTVHCQIRQTSDGFVALRAGPSADAPLIRRMRPRDEVMLINDQPRTTQPWVLVQHAPGQVAYDESMRTHPSRMRRGYVHGRYLVDCDV